MLTDNLSGSSEAELLKRISAVRNPEPETVPTEEPKAVEVSDDLDTANEIEQVAPEVEAEAPETDESVELEQSDDEEGESLEAGEDDTETLYLDLDGEEVSLETLREWKEGNLRHADYTRKTMALADERKAFEAEKAQVSELASKLNDAQAEIQALMDTTSIDWDELREYDPAEYLKQKELQEKRQEAIANAKGLKSEVDQSSNQAVIAEEQQKLLAANPAWLDKGGKTTDAYQSDMKLMQEYLGENGFTDSEVNSLLQAKYWQTILKAAKFDAQKKKSAALEKKVKKTPLVTKPKSQARSNLDREIQSVQAKLKQTGDMKYALQLQKLKRKKGN